ncbi:winged helix-turn-helix transcriptional regulator [Nonomuraea recticatena]|uniref:winged helix-turn-helix transcriptional regulator n=1 Tax=Nonomuraea recticatena TaxID=46178 RepID=UPI00361C1D68
MLTAGHVLQLIRQGTCRTRKELIEYTGLSRSTITDRVDRLIEAGYIHEAERGASGAGALPRCWPSTRPARWRSSPTSAPATPASR